MPTAVPICTPKQLPPDLALKGALIAGRINPANRIAPDRALRLASAHVGGPSLAPQHAVMMNNAYWGPQGVHLTVSFLEPVPADFQQHFFAHANAWSRYGNVAFSPAPQGRPGQVRVTVRGDGYWSYLGTGILAIPAGQPTLCLQDFDRGMPESEWRRVVRHEVGHTLGLAHEQSRPEVVRLLDPARTIAYFERTQGWDEATIRAQILTPLDPATYRASDPDVHSIMCYQFPGDCTVNYQPIPGGDDLDQHDKGIISGLYPRPRALSDGACVGHEPLTYAELEPLVGDLVA